MLKIEHKNEGEKTLVLKLENSEVAAAASVCETNSLKSVIIMKKHDGGAAFYTSERTANPAMARHNYPAAFTVELDTLKKHMATMKDETALQLLVSERTLEIAPYTEHHSKEGYDLGKMSKDDFAKLVQSLKDKAKK